MTVHLPDAHIAQEPSSLFWCHAVTSLHFTQSAPLQMQVAKLASGLFYCWCLLRNKTRQISSKFTSSYGSRRFAACDCWAQTFGALRGGSSQ